MSVIAGGLVVLAGTSGVAASRAGSPACAPVGCVLAADGDFCLCKSELEVCAGERAVTSCRARLPGGTCCRSANTCYCTREGACTFPEDLPTERCDDGLRADPERRCALAE